MPYRSLTSYGLIAPTVPMDEPQATPASSDSSVGKRMARGAAWMVVLRSADRFLGFASMLVLARLLVPADFGLVALGMAVVGSLAAFSEFSFDMALIQNQSAQRKHYDTAWTLGLLRGGLIAGLLLILAQPAAAAMGDERLAGLITVLALIPLLESLSNIGVVEFRKQLVFKLEFLYRFLSRLGGVTITIVLALIWRDYWALVVGQLATGSLRLILSYSLQPYRPRLSLAAWQDLFHFSKWLFLNSILAVSIRRGPTFVIGAILNVASVGIFTLASEIAELVSQAAVAPIKRALFPGYAKLAHDLEAAKSTLLRAHGVVVSFAAPATIGIGLTAELFVPLALGERWLSTISIIEVLAISAFLVAMQGQVRPIFLAINRPQITTFLTLVYALTLIPSLIAGANLAGLIGVAWASAFSRLVQTSAEYIALKRYLGISFWEIMWRVWRPLLSCLVLIVGVTLSKERFALPIASSEGEQLLNLVLIIMIGALIYTSSILFMWLLCRRPADSAETIVLSSLAGFLRGRLGAR